MAYPMHHQLNTGGGGGGDGCAHKQEVETFVATAGQTSFTLTNPASGDVIFSRNGATLNDGEATVSGSTVTYSGVALLAGDRIDISYVWADCSEPANPLNLDWHITGNTGTDDAVNFIGTTDAKNLMVKTNDVRRAMFNQNGGFVLSSNQALLESERTANFTFAGISTINQTHNIFNTSPTGGASGWLGIAFGGTPAAPTLPVSNALMGATNGLNYDGAGNYRTVCRMRYANVANRYGGISATNMPTRISWDTTRPNEVSSRPVMVATENQQMGFGTLAGVGSGVNNVFSTVDIGGSLGTAILVSATAVTITDVHHTVVITGSGVTQPLPTPVARRQHRVKNGGSGTVTVTGHIDGNAAGSITLAAGQSVTLHSNGTTWYSLCCEDKSLPLTYELKLSGNPPVGEQVNQNTEITAVTGSITMVNPGAQPMRFFETASLVEVAVNNIGVAGSPRLGARLQRSTDGGVTWGNHSLGGANPWIPVANGQQQEVSGGQGSYFHTVAANSSLTVNYRALRVIEATAVGNAVSVNFAALEAMIMEIR